MAKINFPKKQEQRLIPKYLLEYAEELEKNHPDPSAEWGGGGSPIEAGAGITITGNETKTISIDNTVALKTDIPTVTSDLTNDSGFITNSDLTGYATEQYVQNQGYITGITFADVTTALGYIPANVNDIPDEFVVLEFPLNYSDVYNNWPRVVIKDNDKLYWPYKEDLDTYIFTNSYAEEVYNPTIRTRLLVNILTIDRINNINTDTKYITNSYDDLLDQPDIPEIEVNGPDFATSTLNTIKVDGTVYEIPQGFSGDYDDLTNKPDLSIYAESADLATVATSGSYNDLSNKPSIPTATSELTNDSGFITSSALTGMYKYMALSSSGGTLTATQLSNLTSNLKSYILTINQSSSSSILYFFYATDSSTSINYITPPFSLNYSSNAYVDYRRYQITINKSTGVYTVQTNYNEVSLNKRIVWGTGLTGTYSPNLGYETIGVDTSTVALKSDIPTATSELINDSGFITSSAIPSNIENMIDIGPINSSTFNLTADQLAMVEAGALINLSVTSPVSLIDYNIVLQPWTYDDYLYNYYIYRNYQINQNSSLVIGPSITITELQITTAGVCTYSITTNQLATVARTGDYSDLSNTPSIPTQTSDLTNDSGFITNSVNNLTNYTLTSNLATVATTGDYTDLTNKPSIPTTATSTSTVTPTTIQLTFTYTDDTTETVTLMTAATVSTTTTLS